MAMSSNCDSKTEHSERNYIVQVSFSEEYSLQFSLSTKENNFTINSFSTKSN